MTMKLTIAFLQLLPGETLEENLNKGIRACREAKEKGADIALFPEMWSHGYRFSHDEKEIQKESVSADSLFVKRFSELAQELDMAIAITFLETHEPKPRNTVCLFDRHGKPVFRYSKVHICDFGEADDEGVLEGGDRFFTEDLDTKEGPVKVGAMICYDREFPESARIMMLQGAELILVPNACPMEINRLSQLRARAFENMLAVATCNYPSPHPDCNGHSTLFDGVAYLPELSGSRDTCVFEAGKGEGVFTADLDLSMLREYRNREVWGNAHRRPEVYESESERLQAYGSEQQLTTLNPLKQLEIQPLPYDFTVCKIEDTEEPDLRKAFFFLEKTDEEISLVCRTEDTPEKTLECEHGWKAFRVKGTLDFSLVGILAEISGILAAEGISIFAVSTYNTDYILVKEENFERALGILSAKYEAAECSF